LKPAAQSISPTEYPELPFPARQNDKASLSGDAQFSASQFFPQQEIAWSSALQSTARRQSKIAGLVHEQFVTQFVQADYSRALNVASRNIKSQI